MKSIVTNYRYWVLFTLNNIMILGIIAFPKESVSNLAYVAILIGSKLVALVALVAFCLLYIKWKDQGTITELTKIMEEE